MLREANHRPHSQRERHGGIGSDRRQRLQGLRPEAARLRLEFANQQDGVEPHPHPERVIGHKPLHALGHEPIRGILDVVGGKASQDASSHPVANFIEIALIVRHRELRKHDLFQVGRRRSIEPSTALHRGQKVAGFRSRLHLLPRGVFRLLGRRWGYHAASHRHGTQRRTAEP